MKMGATKIPVRGPRPDSDESDADGEAVAHRVGLRYVEGDEPGYTRRRCGRGFAFRDPKGRTVPRGPRRQRLESLAIPPAWTDVWICRDPDGHLQATGRDDAGRKQYIYHPRWSEARAQLKFDRLVDFAHQLPNVRAAVDAALDRSGLGRERVLAAVVRLLETTLARIGNDEYAETNESFGLTTLRKRHVLEAEDELWLCFPGKSGRPWEVHVDDPRVVAVISECFEIPGPRLFKYVDDEGSVHEVVASDVNDYLREIGDASLTAKAFRTWAGTILAVKALWEVDREEPEARVTTRAAHAIAAVAEQLGNTPKVCRTAYVHPAVLESHAAGELPPEPVEEEPDDPHALGSEELQVLELLKQHRAEQGSEESG